MHIATLATLKRMSGLLSLGYIKGQSFRARLSTRRRYKRLTTVPLRVWLSVPSIPFAFQP
jgi:hypothetical protein